MQLTMTGEYALRAMLFICSHAPGTRLKIADISSANDIPESFLRQILVHLKNAGFVHGHKGVGGGVSLQVAPETITPLQIIEAVEGKIELNTCLISADACNRQTFCSIHGIWTEAQLQLKEKLASKNMLDLAMETARNRANIQNKTR
jgi:Rrf2 family protein